MGGLRWEEDTKPGDTVKNGKRQKVSQCQLPMVLCASSEDSIVVGQNTHRVLRYRRIVMSCSSGSSMVFRLRPLRRRWRRILALTMRVDEIVGIAGHLGEGRKARTTGALYVSVAAVVGGSSRSRK